jgi:two-component system phosphate regulon sensor histidine kinase PhoR
MPLLHPTPPLQSSPGSAGGGLSLAVTAAAVGALALLGLAVLGRADMVAASAAALIVLLIGTALGVWTLRASRAAALATPSGVATPFAPPGMDAQAYVMALELAPNPVMLVSGFEPDDLAGRRISFANAEARDLLRIPREGALLVAAMRDPTVLESIDESLFGGLDRTISYETGGAQSRCWRMWTKPIPAAANGQRLALVILRDETDMRLNERMRADFLANASHELRTPLASLAGFIETLRGHAKDDIKARERFLAIMSRQAERMARLIDDLLSLSRIELNEHIRPQGACDLALAVADVSDALAPQLEAKSVALQLSLPDRGEAVIVGDRDQIVQVVQNLVDNAVKYSPSGQAVRIEVAAGLPLDLAAASRPDSPRLAGPLAGRMSLQTPTWAGTERYAVLRVFDEGPGIAREQLPRLTERFYRVEGQKSTGTGLGLAIVKHIVNRHRGGFFVESALGVGAGFCVYFPMAPPVSTAAPMAEPRSIDKPRPTTPSDSVTQDSHGEIKLS